MIIFWMYWAKQNITKMNFTCFTFLLWLLGSLKLRMWLAFMVCTVLLPESTPLEHRVIHFSGERATGVAFTVLSCGVKNTDSGGKPFCI